MSKTQQLAILLANMGGGVLERWPGGWWTYPGCPVEREADGYKIPTAHVGTATVWAVKTRGLMEATGHDPHGRYETQYTLTDAGREIARTLDA